MLIGFFWQHWLSAAGHVDLEDHHSEHVRILTMGPKSDQPYVYYVTRERYGSPLRQDIEIYEYQPSMMHAKIILIDDQWVSLGSANLPPPQFLYIPL